MGDCEVQVDTVFGDVELLQTNAGIAHQLYRARKAKSCCEPLSRTAKMGVRTISSLLSRSQMSSPTRLTSSKRLKSHGMKITFGSCPPFSEEYARICSRASSGLSSLRARMSTRALL